MKTAVIDYESRCAELEEQVSELRSELREERLMSENQIISDCEINCQSGGVINIARFRQSMKIDYIIEGLKNYLQAGKNEQALIDFLSH